MLFVGFLWSPVAEYWNDILTQLNATYKVIFFADIAFESIEKFENAVMAIYSTDDIAAEKVQIKIGYMKKYSKAFRLFLVDIPDPKYRLKASTNNNLSTVVEDIKKNIRSEYSGKIKEYFYDIIIHLADNEDQTKSIMKMFPLQKWHPLSLKHFFSEASKFDYAVVKIDTPYNPSNFPSIYAIGKDIDIICKKKDFSNFCNFIARWCSTYNFYKLVIKKVSDDNCLFRLETENTTVHGGVERQLHFQFDLSYTFHSINEEQVSSIIDNSILYNGLKVTDLEDELRIRQEEVLRSPHKKHHSDWITEYTKYKSDDTCEKINKNLDHTNGTNSFKTFFLHKNFTKSEILS